MLRYVPVIVNTNDGECSFLPHPLAKGDIVFKGVGGWMCAQHYAALVSHVLCMDELKDE